MSAMSVLVPVPAVPGLSEQIFPSKSEERKILGHSREADWAIGGAALGFTAALVEFIANNVVNKNNGFSSRKGWIRPAPQRSKQRRKFKDILDDARDKDLTNAFGYDDYDITYRNILREHYIDNDDDDDVYDYEDYSYSQLLHTTLPPETYQHRFNLQHLNNKHVSATRTPWKRRKSVTTTRKQKKGLKNRRISAVSQDIGHPDSIKAQSKKNVLSESSTQKPSSKANVIEKSSTVRKSKDTLQRRYLDQRDPERANLLQRVTSEYERQRKLEKQEAMFNRIMAYTSKNYNKQTRKYDPPINAYVSTQERSHAMNLTTTIITL